MIVMCLDPAFRNVGLSIFDNGVLTYVDTIKTSKKDYKKTSKYVSGQDLNAMNFTMLEIKKLIDKYDVTDIWCELSTAGGQSASAVKGLAYSFAFISAPVIFKDLGYKCCTPTDVKKFVYKKTSGDKDGVMDFISEMYGFERKGTKFKVLGKWIGKGLFEHISDSIAVYEILKEVK
jgi:Holliday junction resolvasome RuvABC endonuclease subunit